MEIIKLPATSQLSDEEFKNTLVSIEDKFFYTDAAGCHWRIPTQLAMILKGVDNVNSVDKSELALTVIKLATLGYKAEEIILLHEAGLL